MVFQQINALFEYFESIGPQFDLAFAPEAGTYYPASIKSLNQVFNELRKNSIIFPNQMFLDAGSGDGRVVALASIFGFDSYGIELNKQIYDSSVNNIKKLYEKKIITHKPQLICGDILNSSTYESLDKKFSEFQIIFNFNTLPYELTTKIVQESKASTIFIFNSIQEILKVDEDLELVKKYDLEDINQLIHVYRKI
jgi:SAM-dependent methyltransferase